MVWSYYCIDLTPLKHGVHILKKHGMGVWNSTKCYFSNAVDSYWRRCNKLIALSAVPYLLNASSDLGFLSSVLKKHLSTVSDFFLPLAYRCFKNYFHRLRFSSRTWFVHKKFFWKCMCVCLYTLCMCKIWWGRRKILQISMWNSMDIWWNKKREDLLFKHSSYKLFMSLCGFFFPLVGVENAYLLKISVIQLAKESPHPSAFFGALFPGESF